MMYLTEVNLFDIARKQYYFKLKANLSVFVSMVWTQIIALLFSFGGVSSYMNGSHLFSITLNYYSGNVIIVFSFIWIFITAITMTTKAYRNDDFAFVSNRLSSNLANIGFLVTASIIGGVSVMLSSLFLKNVIYFRYGSEMITGSTSGIEDFLLGTLGAIFYMLLVSSIGYFIGTLTQINKLFMVFLPILLFSILFFGYQSVSIIMLGNWIKEFLFIESSIALFIVKVMLVSTVAFLISVLLTNRLEVRK